MAPLDQSSAVSAAQPSPALLAATAEGRRLLAARNDVTWRQWGPYLSERQWGTVREDYSPGGTAWEYFPHDHARSRAYRWGEDGLCGFGHENLAWCMGLALWNGRDPILKERLFGLTNSEGNHGEDVKELYYYQDGLPTHSYMRMLYKYPQAAFPYDALVAENRRRGKDQPEYEVVDTGVFDDGRYFDVTVEYAKDAPDDLLMRVTVANKGPDAASVHVLPQLWSRNTWSWEPGTPRPELRAIQQGEVLARHIDVEDMSWFVEGDADLLFCDNETNGQRVFGIPGAPSYPKDAIHARVVGGNPAATNPVRAGTKCAAWHVLDIPSGGQVTLRCRFRPSRMSAEPFQDFDAVFALRQTEAEEFYGVLQADIVNADARHVQRQALAGMLWSKQFYCFDALRWMDGDPGQPPPPAERRWGRNHEWRHVSNCDVISMPDAWEYPWFASWDLDFHCLTLALIDPDFAKQQILLLTRERYMHPDGRLPAYEWEFGDANPPIHAWAALRVYERDRELSGVADRDFLIRVFNKLSMNFTWWVNRKDANGRNVFQGGFLGLDNIAIFDRSRPLPMGGSLSQSDGTAWMAMYALNLMRIAIELALEVPAYEDVAIKYFEHFLYIAEAAAVSGGLWDEADGFFYDAIELPDGTAVPLKVRSMVGLMPLYAVEVMGQNVLRRLPNFAAELVWFLEHRPDLAKLVSRWEVPGQDSSMLLSLLRGHRMKMLLRRMLDTSEFLSDHGVRAVSRYHADNPFHFEFGGEHYGLRYEPGEGQSGLFGGNSNWRGPIWMPVNYLLVESLRAFQTYYGDDFLVEYPTGSGNWVPLRDIADALSHRLISLFTVGADGRRPTLGDHPLMQTPEFRDNVLFYEYFHGDTGRGVGASHQTGWSGLVALLIHQLGAKA